MTTWHRTVKADIGIRLSGSALCGMAYLSLIRLIALPVVPHHAGAVAYGLAAIGVVCTSAGSACVMLGRHLFDEIGPATIQRSIGEDVRHAPARAAGPAAGPRDGPNDIGRQRRR